MAGSHAYYHAYLLQKRSRSGGTDSQPHIIDMAYAITTHDPFRLRDTKLNHVQDHPPDIQTGSVYLSYSNSTSTRVRGRCSFNGSLLLSCPGREGVARSTSGLA
jgi:hypothetical protein